MASVIISLGFIVSCKNERTNKTELVNSSAPPITHQPPSLPHLQAAGYRLHGHGPSVRVVHASLGVHLVRERVAQCNCREQHLKADEEVLVARRYRSRGRGLVHADNRRYDLGLLKHGQAHALPEGQEDHRLDREELEHGFERREQVARGKVEEVEPVQGQRDADVVDDGRVDVATVRAPVAVVVVAERLQEDDDEGHERLHQAELQRRLFAEAQKADRVRLAGQAAGARHARGADGLAADLGHDVALAAQVLVAEGQEVVDDERLVAVAHREEVHVYALRVEEEQRDPRVGGVDGHDEQDAHDPALFLGIRVPAQVLVDLKYSGCGLERSFPAGLTGTHLLAGQEESHPHKGSCDALRSLRLQEDAVAHVSERAQGQVDATGRCMVLQRGVRGVSRRLKGRHWIAFVVVVGAAINAVSIVRVLGGVVQGMMAIVGVPPRS